MSITKEKASSASATPSRDVEVGSGDVEVVSPALAQRFSLFSTLGISYSITATPLSIGTYLSVVVGVGGSPVYFFGYIFAVLMNLTVCFSLAEIASIYPHSSGQAWWTAALAPKKTGRFLSYVAGWLACAAWFFWFASACLISGQLLCALISVCNNAFVAQPWHYYLFYVAIAVFAFLINVPFVRIFPAVLKGMVVWINICALFILITLLVRTHPKSSAAFVFTDFVNETGWSSNGVVFFIGLLPGAVAVNGFDSAAHMSDEMPNPGRQVPQVMIGSALLSAVSGLAMILVYMFCNTKPDNLLAPIGQQPIAQLMLDSMDSLALTIIGIICFITVFLAAGITTLTTFSRVWWCLAKEGGVPCSTLFSKISEKSQLPLNSTYFCVLVTLIIGTIELGSATAINAILGTSVVCIFFSYMIPIACAVLCGRNFARKGYFSLGWTGMTLNIIAVVWMLFENVWLMFPLYLPITGTGMNYSIAVLFGVVVVMGLNWVFHSRKTYVAPTEVEFPMH